MLCNALQTGSLGDGDLVQKVMRPWHAANRPASQQGSHRMLRPITFVPTGNFPQCAVGGSEACIGSICKIESTLRLPARPFSGGVIPGIERQARKRLKPGPEKLLSCCIAGATRRSGSAPRSREPRWPSKPVATASGWRAGFERAELRRT